ncbi:MAG: winged helix-turn-helix domain-containing protein [Actinomycetota bacterium]|nr:winged helix-turn-helix domain-containing protein [Actinomycetota bacterium]
MSQDSVLRSVDVPLVLCIGTTADQLAAVAGATGGRIAVLYLPDTDGLRAVLESTSDRQPATIGGEPGQMRAHCVVEYGKLRLDADLREVTWRGSTVPLSVREFDLLFALTRDPGRVWTFAELTTHVWGHTYVGDTEAVVSAVKRLRRHLRQAAPGVRVESVRGLGYRVVVTEDVSG